MGETTYIRSRMVCLARNMAGNPAEEASVALRSIKGVRLADPVGKYRLRLEYSLEALTFELIEGLLTELGFQLDNNVFSSLRRGIYQYLEDTARDKMQIDVEEHALVCSIEDLPHNEPEKYWNNYR